MTKECTSPGIRIREENRAKRYAFGAESNGLLPEHFAKALDTFRIDQAQRAKDVENYLELARQYTNDTEFFSDFQ